MPLGIVKENGIVVGQLVKYYNNAKTLTQYFEENKDIDPLPYYYKVLDILEELVNNNICYEDVHGGNFLVVEGGLKLIDFSQHRVKINEHYKGMYYNMFQNFVSMVNKLNLRVLNQEEKFDRFLLPPEIKNDTEHLPEDFDYIREHLKTIVKTGRKK